MALQQQIDALYLSVHFCLVSIVQYCLLELVQVLVMILV